MPLEIYGAWTNKGGVGKTTLTFHLSALYAHLNPDTRVVIADLCPQANLSNTVLTRPGRKGSRVVRELSQPTPPLHLPKTVAGYLHTALVPNVMMGLVAQKSDWLVKLDEHNSRMPPNTWLLCGDNRMDEMSQALARTMAAPSGGMPVDNFKRGLQTLRFFFQELEREWEGHNIVVFIDTNPAFTEYTQMALCTIDKLIIPVNADDFSLQAVDYMFKRIWNLMNEQDAFIQDYMNDSFSVKASQRAADILPKVAIVVHNRHSVRATRRACAVQHLNNEQTRRAFTALQAAKERSAASPAAAKVFVDRGLPNSQQFASIFTGSMREMFSAGVASAYTGIPMHQVLRNRRVINDAFEGASIVGSDAVRNLLKDLVKLLAIATDDPLLMKANEERLLGVLGAATMEGVAHQLGLGSVATAYDQAMAAGVRGQADPEPVAAAPEDSEATVSDGAVAGAAAGGGNDDDDANSGPAAVNGAGPTNGAGPSRPRKLTRTTSRGRS